MNREQAKLNWKWVKAYGEGEQLQYRPTESNYNYRSKIWKDFEGNNPHFYTDQWQWRIKPKKPQIGTIPCFGWNQGIRAIELQPLLDNKKVRELLKQEGMIEEIEREE